MKFKKGDRVEYIGNDPDDPISYGDKGKVIKYDENLDLYSIEWDKENSIMHDNNRTGRNYHCCEVFEEEIRKVNEENKMTSNEVINVLMNKLGVEIGEKFNICGAAHNPYYFNRCGEIIDCNEKNSNPMLVAIIYKTRDIEKIPVKEMTVSEIEKALGYKIKVIADKEEKK